MKSLIILILLPLALAPAGEPAANRAQMVRELFSLPSDSVESPVTLQTASGKKSVGLAVLYSLLLPGMGELYAENFPAGKYFLIAEGALWLTFGVFEAYGDAYRDDARAYAVSNAGVNLNGKDEQFFVDIGNFRNVFEYNEKQLQDREPQKLYDPAAGYVWQWTTEDDRLRYRDQRITSDNLYNNQKFVVAAVLVNHVLSAINAARLTIAHNKSIEQGGIEVQARVLGSPLHPRGMQVSLVHTF